jgi:hypothetical protein
MALAGGAAALTEAGRQALMPEDMSLGQRAKKIAGRAIEGGLMEGGGRAVVGALGRFGRNLIPRTVAAGKGTRMEMSEAGERLGRSRLGEGVGERAERELTASIVGRNLGTSGQADLLRRQFADEAEGLINQMHRRGARLSLEEISQPAIAAEEKALGRSLPWAHRQSVINRVGQKLNELLGSERIASVVKTGKSVSLPRAERARPIAQKLAKGARRATREGRPMIGDEVLLQSISLGLRQGLEGAVPGLAGKRAETQGAILAQRALQDMEMLRSQVPLHLGGPVRVGGLATPSLSLSRPQALRLGIESARPGSPLRKVAGQAPRLLDLLRQQIFFDYDDQEAPTEPEVIE